MKLKTALATTALFVAIFAGLLYIFDGSSRARKSPLDGEETTSTAPQVLTTASETAPAVAPRNPNSKQREYVGILRGAALEDFMKKIERRFKTKFQTSITPEGAPFRLSGTVKIKKEEGQTDNQALLDFLSEIAPALDIDSPEQLTKPATQSATLGRITSFKQEFMDIPVEGSQVRVHQDSQGNVFMVNSTYIPEVSQVVADERVTAEQAREQAYADAIARHPSGPNQVPLVRDAVKVIYRFSSPATTDISWKILISQPWVGADGMNAYFVNTRTGAMERKRTAVE